MSTTQVQDGLPENQRWPALIAVGIAVAMSVLVGSIANVALPTIAADLQVTPAESIWVVNAYQLAVTVSLLPFSSLGDVYGHRRIYAWGIVLFTLASLIDALFPNSRGLAMGGAWTNSLAFLMFYVGVLIVMAVMAIIAWKTLVAKSPDGAND